MWEIRSRHEHRLKKVTFKYDLGSRADEQKEREKRK